LKAASDSHGRVRLEAIVTASWLPKAKGMEILDEATKHSIDDWMQDAYRMAVAHLDGRAIAEKRTERVATGLSGADRALFLKGKTIYAKEGYCITCHQPDGKGLPAAGFPPLAQTKWVTGSEDRLVSVILKGLHGPMTVNGTKYAGQVPMTPFGGMLKDEEIAAIATYVRNSFGNKAPAVSPQKVKAVRAATKNKTGFYAPADLLKLYPLEK
ncbi:MAG: cytochrome c, partial [Pedobacter sp.]